jgi:hypothetical protein
MRIAGVLALLAMLASPAEALQPPATISRTQIQAMGPDAVARMLFGDRAANILPPRTASGRAPVPDRPLRLLTFWTVGRATSRAGLCQSDQIEFSFEPTEPDRGADTQVRQRQTWSSAVFYLPHRGVLPSGAVVSEERRAAEDAACRAVDPQRSPLIFAPDPDLLAQAMGDAARVIAAARRGRALPLDCSATGTAEAAPLDGHRCRALVGGIDIEQQAQTFRASPGQVPGRCFEVMLGFDPRSHPISWAVLRIENDGPGTQTNRVVVTRLNPPPIVLGN